MNLGMQMIVPDLQQKLKIVVVMIVVHTITQTTKLYQRFFKKNKIKL